MSLKRSASQCGLLMGYALEVICPNCKTKQSYIPRKNKENLRAKINPLSVKSCVVCGKSFSIAKNILRERDIKTK